MQEEEAALLALGAVLEWKPVPSSLASSPDNLWEEARLDNDQGYQMYDVAFAVGYSPLAGVKLIYWKKDERIDRERQEASDSGTDRSTSTSTGYRWYNSVAEAKAACEIHALTGQFPPGVETVERA